MKTTTVLEIGFLRLLWSTDFLGGWQLKLISGSGAGYKGWRNFSAWLGNGLSGGKRLFRARRSVDMYRARFSLGLTRNGNDSPWLRA